MTREEARAVRAEGARVEYWDPVRGGWRRGLIRTIHRESPTAVILETGKTRGTTIELEKLDREMPPLGVRGRRKSDGDTEEAMR